MDHTDLPPELVPDIEDVWQWLAARRSIDVLALLLLAERQCLEPFERIGEAGRALDDRARRFMFGNIDSSILFEDDELHFEPDVAEGVVQFEFSRDVAEGEREVVEDYIESMTTDVSEWGLSGELARWWETPRLYTVLASPPKEPADWC